MDKLFIQLDSAPAIYSTMYPQFSPTYNEKLYYLLPIINFLNYIPGKGKVLLRGITVSVLEDLTTLFPEYEFDTESSPDTDYIAQIILDQHIEDTQTLLYKYPKTNFLLLFNPRLYNSTFMYPNGYLLYMPFAPVEEIKYNKDERVSYPALLMILRDTPISVRVWNIASYFNHMKARQIERTYGKDDPDKQYMHETLKLYLTRRGSCTTIKYNELYDHLK